MCINMVVERMGGVCFEAQGNKWEIFRKLVETESQASRDAERSGIGLGKVVE